MERADIVACRAQAEALAISLDKFIAWNREGGPLDADGHRIDRRLRSWLKAVQDVQSMATLTMLAVTPVVVEVRPPEAAP